MTDSRHQVDPVSDDADPTQTESRDMGQAYLESTDLMEAAVSPDLLVGELRVTYALLMIAMLTRLPRDCVKLCTMRMDDSDDIRLWVWVFPIEGNAKLPSYEALSYVCGQGECNQEIFVNRSRVMIKPGLMTALRDYKRVERRQDKLCRPNLVRQLPNFRGWLWVDALCIRQEDPIEKSEQIQKMHEIYCGANNVVVTLGGSLGEYGCAVLVCQWIYHATILHHPAIGNDVDRGESEREMFRLATKLEQEYNANSGDLSALLAMAKSAIRQREPTAYSDVCAPDEEAIDGLDLSNDRAFFPIMITSCIEVFEHEWFYRVWTFQELSLGGVGGRINGFLGDCRIDWDTITILRHFVTSVVHKLGSQGLSSVDAALRNRVFARSRLQQEELIHPLLIGESVVEDDLCKLFCISARRRASVKADHVYALLVLMSAELRGLFSIDYSVSDAEVFVCALRAGMKLQRGCCEFLLPLLWERLAWISPRTAGLPSWCPDLSNDSHSSTAPLGVRSLSQLSREAYNKFARFEVLPGKNILRLNLMPSSIIARGMDIACPPFDLETNSLPTTRDIRKHFGGPASVGAWMVHLIKLVDFDADDGIELAAFLWRFPRPSMYPDTSFDLQENESTGGARDHDFEAAPLACKCETCLSRFVWSMIFLHHFLKDNRHTSPSVADKPGYYTASFINAAFALRLLERVQELSDSIEEITLH
jgi:hypothetical protein